MISKENQNERHKFYSEKFKQYEINEIVNCIVKIFNLQGSPISLNESILNHIKTVTEDSLLKNYLDNNVEPSGVKIAGHLLYHICNRVNDDLPILFSDRVKNDNLKQVKILNCKFACFVAFAMVKLVHPDKKIKISLSKSTINDLLTLLTKNKLNEHALVMFLTANLDGGFKDSKPKEKSW